MSFTVTSRVIEATGRVRFVMARGRIHRTPARLPAPSGAADRTADGILTPRPA